SRCLCLDTGEGPSTVVGIHIGSSSHIPSSSVDAPVAVRLASDNMNCQLALADWLMSGQLVRHPGLKLAFSESQIGWMPYVFERLDTIWRKGYKVNEIPQIITEPPSSY